MVLILTVIKSFGAFLVELMEEFYKEGNFCKGFNSAFITLIPKKDHPSSLLDYRLISQLSL